MGNKQSSNGKPAEIIDGIAIAASIRGELKAQVAAMKEKHGKVSPRIRSWDRGETVVAEPSACQTACCVTEQELLTFMLRNQ